MFQKWTQIPGVRRSSRDTVQTKRYIPTHLGKRYGYATAQLEAEQILHPDQHIFMHIWKHKHMYQADAEDVAAIMTQLSLKAGLKMWGHKAKAALHSEMKQLHLRETFKPMRWHALTKIQKLSVLESHMFLKEKR